MAAQRTEYYPPRSKALLEDGIQTFVEPNTEFQKAVLWRDSKNATEKTASNTLFTGHLNALPPYFPKPSDEELKDAYEYLYSTIDRKNLIAKDLLHSFLELVAGFANIRDVRDFYVSVTGHVDVNETTPVPATVNPSTDLLVAQERASKIRAVLKVSEANDMYNAQSDINLSRSWPKIEERYQRALRAKTDLLAQGAGDYLVKTVVDEDGIEQTLVDTDTWRVRGNKELVVNDPDRVISRSTIPWSAFTLAYRVRMGIAEEQIRGQMPLEKRRRMLELVRYLDKNAADGWAKLTPKIIAHIDSALDKLRAWGPQFRVLQSARAIVDNPGPRSARTKFAQMVANEIGLSNYKHPTRSFLEKHNARLEIDNVKLCNYFRDHFRVVNTGEKWPGTIVFGKDPQFLKEDRFVLEETWDDEEYRPAPQDVSFC